jgi:hypothetical protein
MTRLRSCDACARHVFVTETRCPFCSAELAPATPPIFDIKAGMSRAQRYTLVAAVATQALIGCSDDPDKGGQQGTGGSAQQGTGGVAQGTGGAMPIAGKGGVAQPVYGAPIATGGTGNAGSGGRGQVGGTGGFGGAQAVYGAPIPDDAGMPDAGDAGDEPAMKDGGPMIQPVYGVPVYGIPPMSEDDK